MNTIIKLPFYAKASLLLIGLYVFISMLSIGQDILIPVIYAIIIAILLSPIVDVLEKIKINRIIAIAIVLLSVVLIIATVIGLLYSQITLLSESWPELAQKFQDIVNQTVKGISNYFNISVRNINGWIANTKTDVLKNSNGAIGNTLTTIGGVLGTVLLTPVYVFMLLFYQSHLVEFIHRLFGAHNNTNIAEILGQTKSIIQSYLVGLFIEFLIIAVLNSIGLFALGIDYPILLGITGAVLNVIPYIGGLIGVFLFVIVAVVTKPAEYILYVVGLYTVIQLIDNNYIVPKIVGSKVKLNAFVSILAVIAGAALWGIPGMFLSIPITAIIKLIFDRLEALKPWGFLLGDTTPPLVKLNLHGISKKIPKIISTIKRAR